jgi:hypothetical protein
MTATRSTSIAVAVGAVALALLAGTAPPPLGAHDQGPGAVAQSQKAACPDKPVPTISSQLPADVCIPDGFPGIALDYFDDYSWRAFVSLAWPASPGKRGVPASSKGIAAPGARVFETYKPLWEIFHADGSAPVAAFNRYDAASANPCAATAQFGDVTIGSATGIDDIGQAGIGVLDPPIVAQNGRYVRTLTLFNQIAFDHIVRNRYFLRDALPQVPSPRPDRPVIDFPNGSVAIKSAWVDVTGMPPALVKRLYTRTALVKRPASPPSGATAGQAATGAGCARATIGLIGLHIAQKTPSRPQWIWSSFEQVDLVPPKWADWPGAFALNDAKGAPMPESNPLSLVPLAPEPVPPFNVVRDSGAPILTATELTSFAYRRLLHGTPWQHYRLIVTQWPRLEGNQADPIPARVDGSIENTFPGAGAFSAFANVTMETFDQKGVQLGCMSCHNRARMTADFMWTVIDHAYPPRLLPAPRQQ